MKIIEAKVQNQLAQQLPFVLYCKPNSEEIIGLFQQNDTVYKVEDYTEKGFVFASFDGNQTYIIPENQSEIMRFVWDKKEFSFPEKEVPVADESEKKEFENLVAKGIQGIKNQEFKKVVLSRKETVDLVDFDLERTFEKLVQLYPTTFVYCFFHPKLGTWLGATPEQLLKANDSVFETIALAGTQKANDSSAVIWKQKEKEEQQFVTDYIVNKLKNVASDVLVSEPYSIQAGSIWHIKTDISGVFNLGLSLQQVVSLLHPTPAVCGLPKEDSKAFILENEKYDRTFYTGFLGELNSSLTNETQSSDLFVNLRCMQIVENEALLYMGCGITKDSIPEKEWEESSNKSVTMKKVL
ncbi:chorismate-binding protein [Flavobacterium lacustre]|uniref:chorismate-binding protein n=1 Tax=Flavobacterium lacustre TaxID=3016339 RepID=UPI0022B7151B|nr:chorismate-binding protein [Flavobacterium lacustre]